MRATVTRSVVVLLLLLAAIGVQPVRAHTPPSSVPATLPSIADKTKGFDKQDGFVPLHWNRADGTIWLEIPALDTELLYYTSLSAGLGSNDIGLDRGQLGAAHVVRLRRIAARLKVVVAPGDAQAAHGQLLQNDIARFLARPYPQAKPGTPPTVPPGAPIGASWGSVEEDWCAASPAGSSAPFFPPLIRRGAP